MLTRVVAKRLGYLEQIRRVKSFVVIVAWPQSYFKLSAHRMDKQHADNTGVVWLRALGSSSFHIGNQFSDVNDSGTGLEQTVPEKLNISFGRTCPAVSYYVFSKFRECH